MALRFLHGGRARGATATSLISRSNLLSPPPIINHQTKYHNCIQRLQLHDEPGSLKNMAYNTARSAIHLHNQTQNSQLEFVKILRAHESIEERTLHLVIEVNDGGKSLPYCVDVKCKPAPTKVDPSTLDDETIRRHNEVLQIRRAMKKPLGRKQYHPLPECYKVLVEDCGRFAVNLHNQKENAELKFIRVVKADRLPVVGQLFYVTIEVDDAGKSALYRSVIYCPPWWGGGHKEVKEQLTLVDDETTI